MTDSINYSNLMQDALRMLIQKVMREVASQGLPGDHHFLINFDTTHPDVELADWMYDSFPDEMMIVIQHWFVDLDVTDSGFHITLNFNDRPTPLYIPFGSITSFSDPSVEFGLHFETNEPAQPHLRLADTEDDMDQQEPITFEPSAQTDDTQSAPKGSEEGEVVSLDSFRKQ